MVAERTVHLFVGLPGAGKTTVARTIAGEDQAVRFTLDEWMLRLHGLAFDEPSYGELAARCQELIWDMARQVLDTGADVILDWSMWSRERRRQWAGRARNAGARCVVHYVATPESVAVARAARRDDPHAHQLTANDVIHMVSLLEPPDEAEGIEIVVH